MVKLSVLLNGSIGSVWDAITKPELMKLWYFENIPDFKPEVGFTTSFEMKSEERTFTATWSVTKVITKKIIECNWSYEEYEGLGSVIFQLTPVDNNTLFTVTNTGLETFPKDIPEFTEESCLAGWEYFIKSRLKDYVEKKYIRQNK